MSSYILVTKQRRETNKGSVNRKSSLDKAAVLRYSKHDNVTLPLSTLQDISKSIQSNGGSENITIHPKLKISHPSDMYEQEADRVADKVISMAPNAANINSNLDEDNAVTRRCFAYDKVDAKEQRLQESMLAIHRASSSSANYEATDNVTNEINNVRSNNTPSLDSSTKEFMESRFGYDFSNVRVHTDEIASRSAESVNALAYTAGNDIAFGQGQYQPNTMEGRRLLAHELAHVVQHAGKTSMVHRQKASQQDAGTPSAANTSTEQAWDYDPQHLLGDPNLNPNFVSVAKSALADATSSGLHPVVHEAYRTAERSDELYKKYKQGGPRAAPAWASLHNYGLAMDVWLYDSKGKYIDNNYKGWYKEYQKLASYTKNYDLVWGEPINDADHFEYHPNWKGLTSGSILNKEHSSAMKKAEEDKTNQSSWLEYFWGAAGAGGKTP